MGASNDTTKIRGRLLQLLCNAGFAGPVFPVNPSQQTVQGLAAYASVLELPQAVDLALIAVAADQVMGVLEQCQQRCIRAAAIYSAGANGVPIGQRLQDQVAAFAQRSGMRILGPNCEGFFDAERGLVATFSPTLTRIPLHRATDWPLRQRISIVSQSGAMAFALYGKARAQQVPVQHLISTGNEADVELLEAVDYVIADGRSRAVLLFVEGFHRPERFAAVAAKAAEAGVVLIVAKIGRSNAGQRAAVSHTAHLTGADTAYDAVLRAHGAIRVDTPEDMLAIAAAVSAGVQPQGKRVGIVTTSGGAGGWAADICEQAGLEVPAFDESLRQELARIIPAYGSANNPVDVTASVVEDGGATLLRILQLMGHNQHIDIGLIVVSLVSPERMTQMEAPLKAIYAQTQRPLVFHSPGVVAPKAMEVLARVGGLHLDLEVFAKAMLALSWHQQFLHERQAVSQPPAATHNAPTDHSQPSWPANQGELSGPALREFLTAWQIALPPEALVRNASEAATAAEAMGFPVALKIASPDIAHKTEAGGVALDLADAAAVAQAAEQIFAQVQRHAPQARIDGLQVQRMMPPGHEMVIGVVRDADFGPLVMLGLGGIYIEVLRDVVFAPAPLTAAQARAMVLQLKALPILQGVRGQPAADIDALVQMLVQVSRLAAEHADRIQEIDLNPVLVYPAGLGAVAVDALLVTQSQAAAPSAAQQA
ncbi:CoA-binding protein [Lampropedia puyangensis]|uniref:CoA-binding protein n=1 Tax=Lampropedia puyangensis TaxID=1330072 RepID=A0A4S8EPZ8_9BURK|nr:CoA-binding protein [Lampropedia puyangensis]